MFGRAFWIGRRDGDIGVDAAGDVRFSIGVGDNANCGRPDFKWKQVGGVGQDKCGRKYGATRARGWTCDRNTAAVTRKLVDTANKQ